MDPFTRAYLECALWASLDEEGRPLDADSGLEHFPWRRVRDGLKRAVRTTDNRTERRTESAAR